MVQIDEATKSLGRNGRKNVGHVRFLFAIMLCIGNMIIYGLKVNVAVAIVGMVKKTASSGQPSDECPEFVDDTEGAATDLDGPFEWTTVEQGLVVSIYFAGYLVGMFPSGYFADRFNTKAVLLICILGNAVLTLLVPLTAHVLWLLYAVRFTAGLLSAANLPVVNVLVGKWVIYEEKSTWVGIIYGGTSLGTVISILSSGIIMNYFGWEAIFYIHGILPLIWCAAFHLYFRDCPEEQKYITEEERALLVNSYGHRSPGSGKAKIPWKAIFKSRPFLALIVVNTLGNFCWYFLLTQLPTYMNRILRFNIMKNATISCTPYFLNAICNPLLGKGLDWGRKRGYWSQTGARKIAVGISCIPPSICLVVIAYIGCDRTMSTILLSAGVVLCGAIFVGHLTNQNDLAPNFAGILMGITNTPGTISAFILPWMVGSLMADGHTMERWRYIFWFVIGAQLLAFVIFMCCGSAKIQPWNYPDGIVPTEGASAQPAQAETKT